MFLQLSLVPVPEIFQKQLNDNLTWLTRYLSGSYDEFESSLV